jgi:hypothetical protein
MIVVFGGVLAMLFFMFESLGIGEYVWPILIPIFGWTFGIMAFICLIVGIGLKVGGGIPSDQVMVRRQYMQPQPTYPSYDSPSTGAVYVIPVYCPHCVSKLDLDTVEWIGSGDLICPSCQRTVQAGVRENF